MRRRGVEATPPFPPLFVLLCNSDGIDRRSTDCQTAGIAVQHYHRNSRSCGLAPKTGIIPDLNKYPFGVA